MITVEELAIRAIGACEKEEGPDIEIWRATHGSADRLTGILESLPPL